MPVHCLVSLPPRPGFNAVFGQPDRPDFRKEDQYSFCMLMNTIWPRNPSVDAGLAALVFDVRFQNFETGSADRAEEEAARPEGARTSAAVDRAEAIQHSRRVLAFEHPNQVAKYYGGGYRSSLFAAPLHNLALGCECNLLHTGLEKVSLLRSECMPAELGTKNNVHGQVVNTVVLMGRNGSGKAGHNGRNCCRYSKIPNIVSQGGMCA